jgi:hypothetical protein
MNYTRAEYMEKIMIEHFKKFNESEQEYLIKKYNDSILLETIRNWPLLPRITDETIYFIYSKIKFRQCSLLNIGFNEKDYKWGIMFKVFDEIFRRGDIGQIQILINSLSKDLQANILNFAQEVNELRENMT